VKGSGRYSQQRSTYKERKYACLSNIEASNHLSTNNPSMHPTSYVITMSTASYMFRLH